MKEDIIINGVSVNELKKQRDAIRQGASTIISQNIELAQTLTQSLIESNDKEEIKRLAKEAHEALDNANVVASVSGVVFFLPFYEEYGNYEGDEIFSSMLDESENELLVEVWDESISQLYSLFFNMESKSRDWHSSSC